MTSAAIKVLALVAAIIFMAVVGIVTAIVQRKFGSKWLWVVWLAPAVMHTGFLLTRIDYNAYSVISGPVLWFAASQFVFTSIFTGMAVWNTAVWFGPRSPSAASNGMSDLPLPVPAGKLEDEHGLTGILGRYQRLLTTYTTALDAASIHPYPSLPRVFLGAFRAFSPSSVRQDLERGRQMGQVPNILALDLTGAKDVLAELETLTIAQLSAIEECHRTNVRRLRQRLIFERIRGNWVTLIGVISSLVLAAEHVGVLKLKDIDLWHLMSGIIVMGADIRAAIFQGIICALAIMLIAFVSDGIRSLPILQRLRAFEDILTIAKAYRKGLLRQPNQRPRRGASMTP